MRSVLKQLLGHLQKGDVVIILFVLGLALGSTLVFWPVVGQTAGESSQLLVRSLAPNVEEQIILTVDLPVEQTHVLQGMNGTVIIEVSGHRARVFEADCPDEICVNTGWLTRPGHRSVCVPNRLVVEMVSTTGGTDLDAIIH